MAWRSWGGGGLVYIHVVVLGCFSRGAAKIQGPPNETLSMAIAVICAVARSFVSTSTSPFVLLQLLLLAVNARPGSTIASFSGLLTPAFVACSSTASDKRWGEKAWEEARSTNSNSCPPLTSLYIVTGWLLL